jgi:hypothetical protein
MLRAGCYEQLGKRGGDETAAKCEQVGGSCERMMFLNRIKLLGNC